MTDLAIKYCRYGYRRITTLLKIEGWEVNHKRVNAFGVTGECLATSSRPSIKIAGFIRSDNRLELTAKAMRHRLDN